MSLVRLDRKVGLSARGCTSIFNTFTPCITHTRTDWLHLLLHCGCSAYPIPLAMPREKSCMPITHQVAMITAYLRHLTETPQATHYLSSGSWQLTIYQCIHICRPALSGVRGHCPTRFVGQAKSGLVFINSAKLKKVCWGYRHRLRRGSSSANVTQELPRHQVGAQGA